VSDPNRRELTLPFSARRTIWVREAAVGLFDLDLFDFLRVDVLVKLLFGGAIEVVVNFSFRFDHVDLLWVGDIRDPVLFVQMRVD
jgi:hypothetical protein